MAGDAALPSPIRCGGHLQRSRQIQIAGKIAAARFPLGPNRTKPFAWDDSGAGRSEVDAPERKKLAKQMLEAMMLDEAAR